jgi:hypothetical protein
LVATRRVGVVPGVKIEFQRFSMKLEAMMIMARERVRWEKSSVA